MLAILAGTAFTAVATAVLATGSSTAQIRVHAVAETRPVPHAGDAADDPAIWVAPRRPRRSVVIGTDKRGALAVYDLAGSQLHLYRGTSPNNVDLRHGFRLGRKTITLVATSDTASHSVRLYALDPVTRGLRFLRDPIQTGIGVSGLCLYRGRRSRLYVFVGDNSGTIQQWRLKGRPAHRVASTKVRTLHLGSTTEGCVADDAKGRLYVAEEDVAIWRYGAEPSAGGARTRVDSVGSGHLTADIEGLAIYRRPAGRGYLIASSQGSDSFAVYHRQGRNAHVVDFRVVQGRIDAVTHTDGIEVTSSSLGTRFPRGLFVAQDDRNEPEHQNFKLVDWRALARVRPAHTRWMARRSTYYVDSARGSNKAGGRSKATAWRSLARVNAARIEPGDSVLFRRGRVWGGSLKLKASGTRARPIVIGSYGRGTLPLIGGSGATSCVVITGSFVRLRQLHAGDCSWAGIEVAGDSDRVARCLITRNAAGVDVKAGAVGTKIVKNHIVDNNKMSVLTPSPRNDDSGAFGVALHGDRSEVAWNRISGSDAFSYDYGRDGAAVEVYGGRHNRVHHNVAVQNHDFSELGNSRSVDNTFAYNLVRSRLAVSSFLVTRGDQSRLGPVRHTRLYNNTVYLTGASSQGFVCYAGCNRDILKMRNNIIEARAKVGYADAPFNENHDLFWGGPLQARHGRRTFVRKPRFVSPPHNLRLRRISPAVDRGIPLGYRVDLDRHPARLDGNGDRRAVPDLGAYEYRPG